MIWELWWNCTCSNLVSEFDIDGIINDNLSEWRLWLRDMPKTKIFHTKQTRWPTNTDCKNIILAYSDSPCNFTLRWLCPVFLQKNLKITFFYLHITFFVIFSNSHISADISPIPTHDMAILYYYSRRIQWYIIHPNATNR
jgi:hypothetical protein